MQKTERNHGIDLLKILLAIMVITIHINATGTGQVLRYATESPWRQLVAIMTTLSYPAVNTYILITGYYSYTTHKDSRSVIKSLSLIWLSALFFSLLGYTVSVIGFNTQFQIVELLKRFFPIIRGVWWFYTVYFALLLISPFLNKMIDNMSMGEHRLLLLLLILLMSILPIFVAWNEQLGCNYGYSLIWFITLYLVGSFLRRNKVFQFKISFILIGMIGYTTSSIIIFLWPKMFCIFGITSTVSMYNSVFCLAQAVSLFVIFGNIYVPKVMKKNVTKISSVILASYLLHCQEDIETILWNGIHPASYANSSKLALVAIGIIFGVLILSIMSETLRKKVSKILQIERKFIKITDVAYLRLEKILQVERNEK